MGEQASVANVINCDGALMVMTVHVMLLVMMLKNDKVCDGGEDDLDSASGGMSVR